MKICFIDYYYPPYKGGSEILAAELTKKLVELGNEVFVVTRKHPNLPYFCKLYDVNVYGVYCPGTQKMGRVLFTFASIPVALKVIKKHKIDVIISQEIFAALAGHFAKMRYKKPFIYIHELTAKNIPTPLNKVKMLAQRIILPRLNCDRFISLSKFIKEEYLKKWGIKNVIVIPSGVDLNKFNPFIDGSEIRKKYSISNDTILLVTAKQLYGISAKGLEYAIRAFPLVLKKHKNVKYMIIGDGEGKKALEELTKKLRLEKYVIFVGGRLHEEIPKYLAAADIIIQTFAIEVTVGMSLLEAMGMGKPLLVTESGEIKNILNNSTAMLVEMGNPNSIADGIIKLIENPDLCKRIGKNVYELTKDKYSIDNMVRKILDVVMQK